MQTPMILMAVLCFAAQTCLTEEIVAVYGVPVRDPYARRRMQQDPTGFREPKSLLNTFPFNQAGFGLPEESLTLNNEDSRLTSNQGVARQPPGSRLSAISGYSLLRDELNSEETTLSPDAVVFSQDEETETDEPITTESAAAVTGTESEEEYDTTEPPSPANSEDLSPGNSNQIKSDTSLLSLSSVKPGKNGRKCINKVMMEEETVYEDVVTCDHSYDRRCHTSYTTSFEAQQEEECEENYRKNCFINYEKIAFNQTVKICRNPLVKDCTKSGAPVCRTEYESECSTHQHEHEVEDDVVSCETIEDEKCEDITVGYTTETKCHKWPRNECSVTKQMVKKYSPITDCQKLPVQLCAPKGCGFRQGSEICHDKVKTIVQDKPSETCSIEPQRTCKHVTKLVPRLVPQEECVDVPKEICSRSRTNPRKVQKPVIKQWCYVPSDESGLA